jgi:hypothetical protein
MTKAFGHQRRFGGLWVVVLGCLFFAVRGYHDQKQALQSFDFKPVYSSARCLMDGCDPYDSAQIQVEFLRHGGSAADLRPFRPYNANYPPSALLLVMPLTLLPFGPAHLIWLAVGIVLFCCAAMCVADLCVGLRELVVDCVLAVFVATSTMLIMLAQPAMLTLSLLMIAVWCFVRQRWLVLGVIAFAVSLTFKPHVGALVWLYFLLAAGGGVGAAVKVSYRRLALYTLAATLVLMTPGIVLAYHHPASANWVQELRTNLVGIAAHGSASDPGPSNDEAQSITDLQAVFSVARDSPKFYNWAAIAVFLPLFLAWLYLVMRPVKALGEGLGARGRDLIALGAAAALSFLAIYHRQYDTRQLLLMFPAAAVLASTGRVRGKVGLGLIALATVVTSHQFLHVGERLGSKLARFGPVVWVAFNRPMPLMLLVLSLFFLYCMARPEPEDVRV